MPSSVEVLLRSGRHRKTWTDLGWIRGCGDHFEFGVLFSYVWTEWELEESVGKSYVLLISWPVQQDAKAGSTRLYCWICQPFTNNRWQAELEWKGVFADSEVDVLQKVRNSTSTRRGKHCISIGLSCQVVNDFSPGQSVTEDIVLLGCVMMSYDFILIS